MGLSSRAYANLIDIYLPGVFFTQLKQQPEEDSDLPDIEKYAKSVGTSWTLDMQRMSKEKPFDCLFSADAAKLTTTEWENIDQRLREKRPKGGLTRPFVEMEDDRFIPMLNKASKHEFKRDEHFSVPEGFFRTLENLRINAVHDYEKKTFTWDFSAMITQYFPKSIYGAYQRYAHAEYTRLFFGAQELPHEEDVQKLKVHGNEKILRRLWFNIDWELIENALQGFSSENPYKPGSLKKIIKGLNYLKKRLKRMGSENLAFYDYEDIYKKPVFDHNDEVNIANAWDELLPFISNKVVTHKIKEQEGLVLKIQLLYKVISDESIQVHPKRRKTIIELYRKWRMYKADDIDEFYYQGEDKSKKKKIDSNLLYKSPEEIAVDKERREFIITLFDEEFEGSKGFLNKVHDFIMKESKKHLDVEISRYEEKSRRNLDSALYGLSCDAKNIDPWSKAGKSGHPVFKGKMEKIAKKLHAKDEEDGRQDRYTPMKRRIV